MPDTTRQETLAQQIERVLAESLHCQGPHCFHADRSFRGLVAQLAALLTATAPPEPNDKTLALLLHQQHACCQTRGGFRCPKDCN